MISGWVYITAALIYLGGLFVIATYGDRRANDPGVRRVRPTVYALSIGVYCTSWTYFGSVGYATQGGLEYLAIYVGPAIAFLFFFPLWRRITRLAKIERITSVAHFMSARYGKSSTVAAVVTLIALVGTIPYIALQLKAVSAALTTVLESDAVAFSGVSIWPISDIAFWIALVMGVFSILFGTRHADATEHQEGLMLSIAAESVVKLVALTAVGLFVFFILYDGPMDLLAAATTDRSLYDQTVGETSWSRFLVLSLLSFSMAFLLPRQFHVSVTENNSEREINRAAWLFPLYLVAINLFVTPIALAGGALFGPNVDPDTFVLALPNDHGAEWIALFAFIGGLSAATAMVIVAQVALAIMIGNDIVLPVLIQRRAVQGVRANMQGMVLAVRRLSILAVMVLAYGFYLIAGDAAGLASIGLLSFAAFGQLAPTFFLGLFWRGGTATGAISGMSVGVIMWAITLLAPALATAGHGPFGFVDTGLFGLEMLKPQALFGLTMDPYIHGVLWSVGLNILTFVLVSRMGQLQPVERLQAQVFLPEATVTPSTSQIQLWRTEVTIADLIETVSRYLGEERSARSFETYAERRGRPFFGSEPADLQTVRYAEQLLGSAIGAASARLVLSLLLRRRDPAAKGAIQLLDDATEALQYNRDLLQTALDQVVQGICVFDRDLRLICWNRQFREHLDLPPSYGQVGTSLSAVLRHLADEGQLHEEEGGDTLADLTAKMLDADDSFTIKLERSEMVLEVRTSAMPDGGMVATFSDITERVLAERALATANETLERRVRERTEELTRLNEALRRANAEAETANVSKTRFLAAASHDILQPLNAARLYTSSLVDRLDGTSDQTLITNVEASLSSVEDILGALLDISRLDTGAFKPEISVFGLQDLFEQLVVDYEVLAREKGVELTVVPTSLSVRSDRRLLRRLLQNLVSNAIKYTPTGRVLVGVRRQSSSATVQVIDTGLGIPTSRQEEIFKEFQRLDEGAAHAPGLGLGLSIVERITRVLHHELALKSALGQGSVFSVKVPIGASLPKTVSAKAAPAPRALGQLDGLVVGCLDNERSILEGMQALLSGWGITVVTGQTANELARAVRHQGVIPDVFLVDYHLDDNANGIDAIVQLRWQFGQEIPAMLITADRTAAVRSEAENKSVGMLNKPLKPAALRAYLTQIRPLSAAAE